MLHGEVRLDDEVYIMHTMMHVVDSYELESHVHAKACA